MMKKFLSLVLAAALACALAVPAAAVDGADARLTQVTQKVKQTLGIGDEFSEFYGELQENEISPYWRLEWSGEDASLTVTAGEDGKIYSYSYGEDTYQRDGGDYGPSFPKMTAAQAQETAKAFLSKVLTSGESAYFAEGGAQQPNITTYRLYGTVRLNGLDSPIGFSITVRAEDGRVLRFSRDDLYTKYLGGVPSASAKTTAGQAGALLKDTLSLRLEYVLSEDGKTASLRYLPNPTDEYYVDAQTGKLVNLSDLYDLAEKAYANGMGGAAESAPASADSGRGANLSAAEQEGIAKLEGVLSKDALDKQVRSVSQLGLGAYTLSNFSYSVDRDTGDVSARLLYLKQDGDSAWRRTVTVDAKTGDLMGVYSTAPYDETRKVTVSASAAQGKAEAFLKELWGSDFAKTELYESSAAGKDNPSAFHRFTYAQKENGYFFCENSLNVSVDVTDGSISALSRSFDADPAFDSPEGILTGQQALDAYFKTYQVKLAYLPTPEKLDLSSPEAKPLIDLGYTYMYALKLGYGLEREDYVTGIDAKTGETVISKGTAASVISYGDLDGCWGKAQAQELAGYGVGWLGGKLEPNKQLTQRDLVALLASADGYLYDPAAEGEEDYLYQYAYSMGILTKAQRDDDKLLTRAETVKLLLDATGYGKAAKLEGIYKCSFADEGQIPAQYYGYAAIAQGLGVVGGDRGGNFAPNRLATRIEALIMLYNFMSR